MTSSPTWRGQDIELQRKFMRAVAQHFAVKIEQLSVSGGGEGSPDTQLAKPGEPVRAETK